MLHESRQFGRQSRVDNGRKTSWYNDKVAPAVNLTDSVMLNSPKH